MTSFGTTGKVTADFGGFDTTSGVILQNGKLVIAGYGNNRFVLTRYNSDGTLDTSFGTNGTVIGSTGFFSNRMIEQDGKLVAVGTSNGNFALARYNSNGVLDTSFGINGTVITDFGGFDVGSSITLQDDKLVVSGYSSSTRGSASFALARYNSDGTLDTNFGTNGTVVTDFGGFGVGYGIIVQGGKLVVAGSVSIDGGSINGESNFVLARYHANGELDTSFGTNGRVSNGLDVGYNVIEQDGKLIVAGASRISGESKFAFARYSADGELDTSFGINGLVITDLEGIRDESSVIVQDGKLVAFGTRNTDFALARYSANGELDTSFGTNGLAITDFGSIDSSSSATVQADGKIIVVGATAQRDDSNFAIARYNPDGSLDANILPTSADAIVGTIANTPYTFAASDFPFTDANGETLRSIYIVGLETAGSLFFDSDGNGQEDNGEAVRMDQIIAAGDLNKLKFTPDVNVDRASFQFRVRDAYGFSTATYTMSIDRNDPPSISGTPATTIDEDGAYSFTPTAIDPDGTPLTFTIQNQPTWASFDSSTGTLSGTPTNEAVGITSGIVISVSDGVNSIALPAFDLTVNNTNDAPTVASAIADQTAQAGSPFSFTLPPQTFQEIDAQDRLTFSVTQADGTALPSWLSFDRATGQFTGTPPQAGSIALKITATDRANASISDEFVLSIAPASTNPDTINPDPTNPGTTNPTPTTPIIPTPDPLGGQPGEWAIAFGRITNRKNGTDKADRLIGTKGNDGLNGRRGDDLINGRAGDDILDGGRGDDRLIAGAGNDRLHGSAGSDLLMGGAGNDRLIGGSGFGKDILIGGAGSDMFVLTGAGRSHTIADFEAIDRIHLASIFASSNFRGATLAQVVRLQQVGTNTEIQFDIDGLGSGTAFKTLASLQNVAPSSLSASNFVIR